LNSLETYISGRQLFIEIAHISSKRLLINNSDILMTRIKTLMRVIVWIVAKNNWFPCFVKTKQMK